MNMLYFIGSNVSSTVYYKIDFQACRCMYIDFMSENDLVASIL